MAIKKSPLRLAFDVGHSSIGWAVLTGEAGTLEILGTGAVLFPADDCLARERRAFRRQRRHIRATRQRIARMKTLLAHLKILTPEALDEVTSSSPWKLAARVLVGGKLLTWPELWDILRWYAHNRGYDGNQRWAAKEPESQEDTEKVRNAQLLLESHHKNTMAEVFCDELRVDPLDETSSSSHHRFKNLNAAFPRAVVEHELHTILHKHQGVLPKLDAALQRTLLGTEGDWSDEDAWKTIPCPELKIPLRFKGSLLFGQSVPRFDNRIIATCPFTYQSILAAETAAGADARLAKHRAERAAKVPSADCPEFFFYRWAMTMANIRVKGQALSLDQRAKLDHLMRIEGSFTAGEFKKKVREITGTDQDNLTNLLVHPDVEKSLILDPARKLMDGAEAKFFWSHLPDEKRKPLLNQLRRGKSFSIAKLAEIAPEGLADLETYVASLKPKISKKDQEPIPPPTLKEILAKAIQVPAMKGRAPFSRERMKLIYDWVMSHVEHPAEVGGPLYRSEDIRQALLKRDIDDQTNNHLVRHRLKILDRLHRDLVKQYAGEKGNDSGIDRCIIEVTSDLKTFSGMTNKEIDHELRAKQGNFKDVEKELQKDLEGTQYFGRINAGLIRKARVLNDLGGKCPYTEEFIDAVDLAEGSIFDKDHIIPYSQRPSNSLDSLVITFKAINKWKGNRTALEFVTQEQGKKVPNLRSGKEIEIVSLPRFKEFVEKLDARKGHDDDRKRKKRRKDLLLTERWDEKVFLPKDLTQTSQLVRLGAQALTKSYPEGKAPHVISLPGSITGLVRTKWNLVGCLKTACPAVEGDDGKTVSKGEVRKLTHLHHALDACVLAFADAYFPENGGIWELMLKRDLSSEQLTKLIDGTHGRYRAGIGNRAELQELPNELKENLRLKLSELRVVQHIPSDMSGLKADQTVWRVLDPKDPHPSAQKLLRMAEKKNLKVPDPDNPEEDQAMIICWKRKDPPATRPSKCLHETNGTTLKKGEEPLSRPSTGYWVQYDIVAKTKLFGLMPKPKTVGKLKAQKAVKVVSENFGVAILEGDGVIIRSYNVSEQLAEIRKFAGGQRPKVLRNGMAINVPQGIYLGNWRIRSIKENKKMGIVVDMGRPDAVAVERENVRLKTLLKEKMQIIFSKS